MWESFSIIVPSVLSFILGGIALYYKYKKDDAEEDLKDLEDDLKYDVNIRLEDASKLQSLITELMKNTKVDRFLMFIAENGGKAPLTFTSAILETHKNNMYFMLSVGATNRYVKYRFDEPYRKQLQYIESTKSGAYIEVSTMDPCDLKEIYKSENVKHSSIWFHKRQILSEEKHVIIYSSFATHNEVAFTPKEKSMINLVANQLSSLNITISKC